jgi:hypothetical protein
MLHLCCLDAYRCEYPSQLDNLRLLGRQNHSFAFTGTEQRPCFRNAENHAVERILVQLCDREAMLSDIQFDPNALRPMLI